MQENKTGFFKMKHGVWWGNDWRHHHDVCFQVWQ